MSRDLLEILSEEKKNTPEFHLVDCCAPTLAGMKAGSIFNVRFDAPSELDAWMRAAGACLESAGLYLYPLRRCGGCAMILLYRRSQQRSILQEDSVRQLLSSLGYPGGDVFSDLSFLAERIRSCRDGFPHEIGIFLGYPIEDVKGFIRCHGQNWKICGMWKVYGDAGKARQCFQRFERCREVYWKLWLSGKYTVRELAVSL